MKKIYIFNSEKFGIVRAVLDENGQYMICLKDICKALLMDGYCAKKRVPEGDMKVYRIKTGAGLRNTTFVNVEGLEYALCSNQKGADELFSWLMCVMKNGDVKEETQKEDATPDYMTVTQIAQELDLDATILNRFLLRKKIQTGNHGHYRLAPAYCGKELAVERQWLYLDYYGKVSTRSYLVWTEKGVQFIKNLIKTELVSRV